MKFTRRSCQILAVLLAVPSVVASAEPAQQSFTLGRYVPQDVFLLIHGVHNSERDFIAQHWAPVIEEFANCGIELELKRLISGDLSTEDRAEFEQAWDMVFQLVRGVRWGDLMAREVLFAERLGSITPDLMLLCRSKPGSIEANLEGLKAILHALAEISDSATVTETKRRQARVWSLEVEDVPIGLHLFNQDDVVGVIVGHQGLKDVLGLMAGDDQIGSVVDSPRYRKAAGELPAPETTVMFFDAEALVRGMNNMVDVAFARDHHGDSDPDAPEHEGAQRGRRIVHKMIDHANVFDYVMAVTRTEGLREITTSTARMCTEAMDKPFYSMLCNRKPFERFDRYIPENATGFTVSTFLDLELLYETALDFIRTELSDGQSAIATWNQLQDDIGFNLTEDFFSWWSGE
ncbi:MAG: hypothetical protein GY842_00755, partial [bacterium]|nr:hypothetical protein [bacterium]